MRISALEEYGIRCLLALAENGVRGQASIAEIAEREGISVPYASKLLAILRKAGLVAAVRGRSGGFSISREPKDINLLEVITALGGPLMDEEHCQKYSGQLEECIHTGDCSVMNVLGGLAGYISDYLASNTLEDIMSGNVLNQAKQVNMNEKPAESSPRVDRNLTVLNKRIG
ncbi:MAG: Rrf2 family transcriptional regulator [bacterium]|nr:Rrf2 family transcriptional regulator [bacterium]